MKKGLINNITENIRASRNNKPRPVKKKPKKEPGVFSVSSVVDYVDKMIKLKLSKSKKIAIGKQFTKATGTKYEELQHIRNRHPHYKKLKNKNQKQRHQKRNAFNKGKNKLWSQAELFEFLELNDKSTDMDLAKHFDRSIPAINAVRRRISIIKRARLEKEIRKYILKDERTIRKIFNIITSPKDETNEKKR